MVELSSIETIDCQRRPSVSSELTTSTLSGSFTKISDPHTLLQPYREQEHEKRISAVLSVSNLRFESLGLVGRSEETKTLSDCLTRLAHSMSNGDTQVTTVAPQGSRELVVLKGEPGAGKTSLALTVRNHPVLKDSGIFVTGKYDMRQGDLPYAAFSVVCEDLCRIIMEREEANQKNLRESIASSLLSDIEPAQISTLRLIVPSLASLLKLSSTWDAQQRTDINKEALDQTFKTFFRVISSNCPPLVILLDDLQWADTESLDLLKVLINDIEVNKLMIIGGYRSNEVHDEHSLAEVLQNLREGRDMGGYGLTEILVDHFSVPATNGMIQDLLKMDADETQELAALCHKRTSGNVYFLKEFLNMLKTERLLTFDILTCQWKWDLNEIEARTVVTTNIIQLIEGRLKKMRPALLEVLEIATCLGSRFDKRMLRKVWESIGKIEAKQGETFDTLLQSAIDEAVVESQNRWFYRFSHDKIQESIVKLMPPGDFKTLQAKVASFLLESLRDDEVEDLLFVVVDLLNASEQSSSFVSSLNLRAARKAQSLAAFSSASTYVDYGIQKCSIANAEWEENYSVALELFSIGAEVELCLGNVEKAVFYAKRVINQKKLEPLEKVRAYRVHAKKLYMGRCPDESLKVCLDILGQLGCNVPRVKAAQQLQASKALDTTRKMIANIGALQKKGFISDQRILEMISLLEQGASTALQAKNKPVYILLRCRCVILIIENGLSNEAASCFASFANIMMHENGDWETGVKLANLALAIQERLGSRYTETSTLFKTNQLVLGWATPLKSRLKFIVKGYRSGMLSGNIEGGCWCLMLAIWCQFYDGTPLRCVEEDCRAYIGKMEALRQKNQANVSKWHWQLVLNLIGDPENPNTAEISGTAIAEEEAKSMVAELNMYCAKCFACAHFGEYATGADIALKIGESHYERLSGMAVFGFERFDRGICLYAHARETKQGKYRRAAKSVRSRLHKWVSKGAVNLKHHLVSGEEGGSLAILAAIRANRQACSD